MSKRAKFAAMSQSVDKKIAIIGSGASCVSVVVNLAKYATQGTQIDIYENTEFFGKGFAYSTTNFNHLLNVRAKNMSIDVENSDDFINWLEENGYLYRENDFVPRVIYGIYLQDKLKKSIQYGKNMGLKFNLFHENIENIEKHLGFFSIKNDVYTQVILASGVEKKYKNNPYEINFKNYCKDRKSIHIKGAGLTAIDIVFSMLDSGFEGKIFLHSRSGGFVLQHSLSNPFKIPIITAHDAKNMSLNNLAKKFIKICKDQEDWRSAFDSIRPITQEIWAAFNDEKKAKFLSRFASVFSKHRHRCSEKVFEKLTKLRENGSLILTKSSIDTDFIDCTGLDFKNFDDKLLESMKKSGVIEFDRKFGGVYSMDKNVLIIGPLNFGRLFETIAIPEIKNQAFEICKNITQKL